MATRHARNAAARGSPPANSSRRPSPSSRRRASPRRRSTTSSVPPASPRAPSTCTSRRRTMRSTPSPSGWSRTSRIGSRRSPAIPTGPPSSDSWPSARRSGEVGDEPYERDLIEVFHRPGEPGPPRPDVRAGARPAGSGDRRDHRRRHRAGPVPAAGSGSRRRLRDGLLRLPARGRQRSRPASPRRSPSSTRFVLAALGYDAAGARDDRAGGR